MICLLGYVVSTRVPRLILLRHTLLICVEKEEIVRILEDLVVNILVYLGFKVRIVYLPVLLFLFTIFALRISDFGRFLSGRNTVFLFVICLF